MGPRAAAGETAAPMMTRCPVDPLATGPLRLIASRPRAAGAALGLAAWRRVDGDPNLEATGAGTRIKFLAVALEIWRVGDFKT